MDSTTKLLEVERVQVDDKFYISISLYKIECDELPPSYEIDVHIGGKLRTLGTTKKSGILLEVDGIKKFNEFVELANSIKKAFEY